MGILILGNFSGESQVEPTLPTEYSVAAYSLPTGGTLHTPATFAELQTAVNEAVEGDVIQLAAGTTYSGALTIPPATAGEGEQADKWVYIISDALANLPEGTRVAPANVTHMPKLSIAASTDYYDIERGVSKYRLCGLEIESSYALTAQVQYSIFRIGSTGTSTDSASDIVFDRCYFHGTASGNTKDGFLAVEVSGLGIINCYLDEFHAVGYESHAITCLSGASGVTVDDCLLAAAGVNVLIGYEPSALASPEDIVFRNCNIIKWRKWQDGHVDDAGYNFLVKNLFETKDVNRILVELNALEQCWADGQTGRAVIFKGSGDVVSDITCRRNIIRSAVGFFDVPNLEKPLYRVLIEDNLCYEQEGNYSVSIGGTGDNHYGPTIFRNNTLGFGTVSGAIQLTSTEEGGQDDIHDWRVYDNIWTHGSYGFYKGGDYSFLTEEAVEKYTRSHYFDTNILIGGNAGSYDPYDEVDWTNFLFPANNAAVGFVDDTFATVPDSYALAAGSTYKNAGTDGTDIGCDISLLTGASILGES